MQLCNGDDFGLSQHTISKIISDFLDALTEQEIIRRYIVFPIDVATVCPLLTSVRFIRCLVYISHLNNMKIKTSSTYGL